MEIPFSWATSFDIDAKNITVLNLHQISREKLITCIMDMLMKVQSDQFHCSHLTIVLLKFFGFFFFWLSFHFFFHFTFCISLTKYPEYWCFTCNSFHWSLGKLKLSKGSSQKGSPSVLPVGAG